ncbi:MAG: hypothetical protein K2G93_05515 [Rikenella sp.]|nr:hypothetical protein [Rikenella sp.]
MKRTFLLLLFIFVLTGFLLGGCAVTGRLERHQYTSVVAHTPKQVRERIQQAQQPKDSSIVEMRGDSSQSSLFVANRKSMVIDEDGEAVALLKAQEVRVVAKTRMLAERDGKIQIDFLITMPRELQGNVQSFMITPIMHRRGKDIELEPLQVRGGLFSKLQERNYWRYSKFRTKLVNRRKGNLNAEDTARLRDAFHRFVQFPYLDKSRFDSILNDKEKITYYYTQDVKVEEDDKQLFISLTGRVNALDGSSYVVPANDTLQFNISSMLTFVQPITRYMTKIIEKYAVVNDRNYLTFKVNNTKIMDSLGNNAKNLAQIRDLMHTLLYQHEFYVDSIILTAASSPEGSFRHNNRLAKERAFALSNYLRKEFDFPELDTLLTVRWEGENWADFRSEVLRDEEVANREEIVRLADRIADPDEREAAIRKRFGKDYKYIREEIYPRLRVVDFKYNLRRVGMLKDTIHTTVVDTLYQRGVDLLRRRHYVEAAQILTPYRDQNTAVALLSRGFNGAAKDVLFSLPSSAQVEYLRAIVCSRLGEWKLGEACFKRACELDELLEYRANLDPEMSPYLHKQD